MSQTAPPSSVNYAATPPGLTGHVLERGGCPLHYWVGGAPDRPLVVFTHGATMDHRMFNAQAPALLERYRVLVWDVRGQGRSQPIGAGFSLTGCADDLAAILDAEGAAQAVLVGQSLGGYISQYFYLAHPERVRAMVIIGATDIAQAYSRLDMLGLKASLPLIGLWPYGHFTRTVAKTTAQRPEVRAYALEAIRQIPRADFLTIWKAVTLAISAEGIPGHRIRVPLLLTHGDRDANGSIRRDAPGWASREPDVEYVVIPAAAHNANQDNPDFFNRTLLDFLARRVG